LNPRRPTPSGPQPVSASLQVLKEVERFYPSYVKAEEAAISGKSDASKVCIALTDSLLQEFEGWLRFEEGTSDKTVKDYLRYLGRASGLKLCSKEDVSKFFELAGMNKRSYESLRRFLTFVERRRQALRI
jgi:hypothetical protein